MRPLITLTTDFGNSFYVGQLKGVLLSRLPECQIIDITHQIPPQDIVAGAMALADSVPFFPPSSIHIGVVDPGVGTDRPMVAARIGQWIVLGPDNGLLSTLAEYWPVHKVVRLNRPEYWIDETSRTFHGRDILAPIAAHIAKGVSLQELGDHHERLHPNLLPIPRRESNRITGKLVVRDHYGNLITNIRSRDLPLSNLSSLSIRLPEYSLKPFWVETYGQANVGDCVALLGSSKRVEVSVVNGDASKLLSWKKEPIILEISW